MGLIYCKVQDARLSAGEKTQGVVGVLLEQPMCVLYCKSSLLSEDPWGVRVYSSCTNTDTCLSRSRQTPGRFQIRVMELTVVAG